MEVRGGGGDVLQSQAQQRQLTVKWLMQGAVASAAGLPLLFLLPAC